MSQVLEYAGQRIDIDQQLLDISRAECEESLSEFVRQSWHVIEPGQPYVHGWHIDFICEHLEAITYGVEIDGRPYNRLLVNIPPGPGWVENLVMTDRGRVRLGDIKPGDMVLTHRGRFRRVSACYSKGMLDTLVVRTRSGREMVLTPDHNVLTPDGWIEARDLAVGSTLAVVTPSEGLSNNFATPEEARLLGYLIGDGSITQATVSFTNHDLDTLEDFERCAASMGFSTKRGKVSGLVRIHGGQRVHDWLESHGLFRASSYDKHIPDAVLRSGNEIIRNFIGAYWSCDGMFDVRATKSRGSSYRASATTVSKRLAEDLLHALTRIGIRSVLRPKARKLNTAAQPGGVYRSYNIEVYAEEDTARFIDMPGLSARKNALARMCAKRRFDSALMEDPAVEILPGGERECMCISVDEDHSLTWSDIAVHNTMKSLILNVFWPAWEWGPQNMPHLRYVCAAHKVENLSARDSRRMRQLITSDWYIERWGDRVSLAKDQNEKLNFHNRAGGFRIATAITSLTGIRGDRVLCFPHDEIVHTENGPVKIGDLVKSKSNARVWSSAPGSSKHELKRVSDWKSNPGSEIVEVGLSDGTTFTCTPDHKVWTSEGWLAASVLTSSHTIPRQSIADCPDGSGRNTVFSGQSALRSSRAVNFKNLFGGQSRPTGFFSAPIIVFLEFILRKLFPRLSTPNLLNYSRPNAKPFAKNFGNLIACGNDSGLRPIQFGSGALLMDRKGSVSFGVSNVLSPCSIFEIAKSRVAAVSVLMANLVSLWWRANERKHNGLMDKHRLGCSVFVGVESRVALAWRRFKYLFRNCERSSSNAVNDAGLTADAAQVAYAVEALETGDRFPVFVRKVGHVDETFCLSVQDNHSFFVGNGKGVLVSNCDDPHSVDSAASDTMREAEVTNFLEAIPSRLNNPEESAIVVIMQRLHENDVSGVILDKGLGYDHIMLPMRYDPQRAHTTKLGLDDPRQEDGELLFPARFPLHVVERDEKAMGPYASAGQFQQEPTPRGGGVIKAEWWGTWPDGAYPPMDFIVASLDPAYTAKQENDYSALTVWGVYTSDNSIAQVTKVNGYDGITVVDERIYTEGAPRVMLMAAWQERLELHDLVEKVSKTCRKMRVDVLLVEAKASGLSVAQEIRRLYGSEPWGVQLINPGAMDKLARLYSIQHLFSEGMITAPDRTWADQVIRQCEVFPKGKHDDLVDTTSQALRHLRDIGLLTRAPERIAELEQGRRHVGALPPPLYPV